MRDFAKELYSSKAWKRTREAYRKSRRGLCERCLEKGLIVPGEIVHHRIHLTPENVRRPEIALSWDNLELLCRECHGKEHGTVEKRYTVDETGRVTAI